MRKGWKWLLAVLAVLILAGGAAAAWPAYQYISAVRQFNATIYANFPATVTDSDLAKAKLAIQGAKGQDLRRKNFRGAMPTNLYDLTYDTQTRWPGAAKLPAGYDPAAVLKAAVDPGLGLGALHAQGIDGRSIAVAVIDKPIRSTHQEFAGRIHYIEVFPGDPRYKRYHFHGAATASILAGKSVGVAPGATLYYFATPDSSPRHANYAQAMEQLLALNATLPPAERIRVVSISDGYMERDLGDPAIAQWDQAIRKAEAQGIAVVHCATTFPFRYDLAGVEPDQDRNNPEKYFGSAYAQVDVPAHMRTTAGNESDKAYTYWGEGGMSWAAPYLAGMVALGLQVNPDATREQIYKAIVDTTTVTGKNMRMVNPTGFIQRIRR